ncbi:MAG: YbaB/EbfC family nucleoid-associated protein [Treponema sp.]|nr:YbaB/EbfC family nucleoid-associated protein [Treponema sp.]
MNINPFEILKNAQKIQEQMGDFQQKLALLNASGSAGGGMVQIDLNGRFEITAVHIANEVAGDVELLQDLVMAAFTDGMAKIREGINSEMSSITGGLNIPGLSGMPGFPGAS